MSAMGGSGNRTDQIASLMIELHPVHERRSADEIKQDILSQTKLIAGIIVEAYKIENKPGKINAIFQFKISTKKPATKAPEPMPTPPNIPLIPNALPFLLEELKTHAMPTG